MSATKDLFQLVSSLSSAEKRAFKVMSARQEGEKQYLHLFDELEKMATAQPPIEPDEEILKTRLKRKGVKEGQFHVVRNYLLQLIFKTLRIGQDEDSREDALKITLQEAKVLERRGLFESAIGKLETALAESKKYAYHALTTEILQRLVYLQGQRDLRQYALTIQNYLNDIEQTAQKQQAEAEAFSLHYRSFILYRTKKGTPIATFEVEMRAVYAQLGDAPKAHTLWAQVYFHHAQAALAELRGDPDEAFRRHGQVLKVWEEYPDIRQERLRQFVVHTANYLNFCIARREFDRFEEHFKVLKNVETKIFDDEAEVFQNRVFLEQFYYLNRAELEKARDLVPEIESGLQKYRHKINKSRELALRYHSIVAHFALEEYQQALEHCLELMSLGKSEHRVDVQSFAKILQLIIHFELRDHQYLDGRVASAMRNLENREAPLDFERVVLKNLLKLIKIEAKPPMSQAQTRAEQAAVYADFGGELSQVKAANNGQPQIGLEEVELWVKSKIARKTMKEILKSEN
jgi:hypothetical protein